MSKYKYSWTRKYSVSPQVVGEIVEKLPSRTPEALLTAARSKSSPLHSQFEWDDSRAAQQYRLVQARVMINSLNVEVIQGNKKPIEITAFVRKSGGGNIMVPTLEADDDDLGQAELKCLDHMRTFKARWKGLSFARSVVAEINATEQTVRRKRRK